MVVLVKVWLIVVTPGAELADDPLTLVLVFVQVKVAPTPVLADNIIPGSVPLHIVYASGVVVTKGAGFTATVICFTGPAQVAAVATKLYVTLPAALLVVLANVWLMVVTPGAELADDPLTLVLVFVQVKVAPAPVLADNIIPGSVPLHIVYAAGVVVTEGVAFTVTVTVLFIIFVLPS